MSKIKIMDIKAIKETMETLSALDTTYYVVNNADFCLELRDEFPDALIVDCPCDCTSDNALDSIYIMQADKHCDITVSNGCEVWIVQPTMPVSANTSKVSKRKKSFMLVLMLLYGVLGYKLGRRHNDRSYSSK